MANKYPKDRGNTEEIYLSRNTYLCYKYSNKYKLVSCYLEGDALYNGFTVAELAALRRELMCKTSLEDE